MSRVYGVGIYRSLFPFHLATKLGIMDYWYLNYEWYIFVLFKCCCSVLHVCVYSIFLFLFMFVNSNVCNCMACTPIHSNSFCTILSGLLVLLAMVERAGYYVRVCHLTWSPILSHIGFPKVLYKVGCVYYRYIIILPDSALTEHKLGGCFIILGKYTVWRGITYLLWGKMLQERYEQFICYLGNLSLLLLYECSPNISNCSLSLKQIFKIIYAINCKSDHSKPFKILQTYSIIILYTSTGVLSLERFVLLALQHTHNNNKGITATVL